MNPIQFLILQLAAHILADFFFQNDRLATEKNALGFRSPFLKWHALIVFALSWLFSFRWLFVFGSLTIAITHYLIDGLKPRWSHHRLVRKYAFFIDQFLHVGVIIAVLAIYFMYLGIWPEMDDLRDVGWYLVGLAYLVCLKPSNIFIKEVFNAYDISVPGNDDLPNAGKLIGVLERILVLTFILMGQLDAVGFLIAAKSILRFKNDDSLKAEYVLIGTLLSFGIAVIMGVLVKLVYFEKLNFWYDAL